MTRRLVLGSAIALLTGLVLLPLAILAWRLVEAPDAALAALAHPLNLEAAGATLLLSLSVLSFTLLLGVPLGWLIGRTNLPGASTWRAICTVPYVVPPYISAIAWDHAAQPHQRIAEPRP